MSPSSDLTAPGALPAQAVLDRIRPLLKRPDALLLIDGRSGSGKSSLAAWLAPRLHASVLHLEDLYPGWSGLDAAATVLAERILPALTTGRPARFRRWDWALQRSASVTDVLPRGPLLVEGCGALTCASRPFANAAVLLEVPDAVRAARIRHRDPPEAMAGHRLWAAQERRLRAREPQRSLADLVLGGGVRFPGCAARPPATVGA